MKKAYLLVILGVMGAGNVASAKPMSLSLAIRYAVEHSPSFDSARRSQEVAALQRQNAFNSFLPSLDLTTTDGLQQLHPAGTTDPYSTSFGLSLKESLYDNGASLTNYRIAKLNYESSTLAAQKARNQLALEVAQQYYRYSLATKLQEVKKEQLATLQKQLATVTSQYEQGFKMKKDFLRFKAQVQKAELDLLDQQTTVQNSEAEIKRLIGYSNPSAPSAEPLEIQTVKIEAQAPKIPNLNLKLEDTFDYRILKAQGEIQKLNVNLVTRNYWPQVSLAVNGLYNNSGFYGPSGQPAANPFVSLATPAGPINTGGEQFGWSALVTIQYNLWDWGTRKNNVAIAEHSAQQTENTYRSTLVSTTAALQKTKLQLEELRKSFDIQTELLNSEQQSYEIVRIDYREGKIPYIDMITSLNDLLSAKVTYYTTYFSLLDFISQYQFYEGHLYEKVATP